MTHQLTSKQREFLEKARLLWRSTSGGIELKRSIGVVEAVLKNGHYSSPQEPFIDNVREWYLANYSVTIKVGDVVRFRKTELDKIIDEGEFEYKPYLVEEITKGLISRLSGIPCKFQMKRFTVIKEWTVNLV